MRILLLSLTATMSFVFVVPSTAAPFRDAVGRRSDFFSLLSLLLNNLFIFYLQHTRSFTTLLIQF